MKKNLKNIIVLYFLFVIACLIFYFYSTRIVYNNLKVIDNFESTKKSFTIKVPSKILIHNKYLGDVKIDNNLVMNDILKYFSNITSSNSKNNNPIKNDNVVTLSGKIYYSNGNTENFTVNNALTLENKTYYNDSYYINTLRNTLFNCLYNYSHIINIINNPKSKITCIKDNKSHTLNKNEKINLLSSLKGFKTMEDNKDFLNINLNENPRFVFNIFIDGHNNSIANNTIYLIVYKNYLVLQYLGDENGKNIYIKGDLNENCFT
ncbi:DUF3919 family protein [Eubacterium multiforme]|uniref:DUF3919 family protein n=1 Tax=Eubacterium multiforme TaxID=83339 RepID=A0ABT9USZ9_9FIRM|nr:DUF3919 family protein [Eubacterium multiforme]MDQ0149409.1 hypothetical protein [Eubacterium multiforme]